MIESLMVSFLACGLASTRGYDDVVGAPSILLLNQANGAEKDKLCGSYVQFA